jgi:predicted nucleic acid-binding protein
MATTLYLLDTNVFRELGTRGHAEVRTWRNTIDDDQIRVSPIVYRELRQGCERELRKRKERGKETSDVEAALAALDQFEKDYADREVPITMAVQRELTKLLGAKDKNEHDMTLAATAKIHGLVIVTRNVKDFAGRDVRVLNPFQKSPKIERV